MFRKRDKQIIKLYSQGVLYAELGRKYKLSLERIRQIINPILKFYCRIHNRRYSKKCELCQVEKEYPKKLRENLEREIARLPGSRDVITVLKRQMIIKLLRDKFKMSFKKIGIKLDRDYASIIYLYHFKKNGKH